MPQWDSIPVHLFCYRVSGHCSGIVGLVQALMHYRQWRMKEIPIEMSCTELQQRWGKPRGNKIKPGSVMSLVCAKAKPDGKMSSKPVTATLTKQRYNPHIKIGLILFCFCKPPDRGWHLVSIYGVGSLCLSQPQYDIERDYTERMLRVLGCVFLL